MIVSLGEALIDLIHTPGQPTPTAKLGGSPFNVATALSQLDVPTGFVCPLSTDKYGESLSSHLQQYGIHQCIEEAVDAPTAIAEVYLNEDGHPQYQFHREQTADRALSERPPKEAIPRSIDALHFGSLVLAQAADWPWWKAAIAQARQNGAFIAFDPNLRPNLIDNLPAYRERLEEAVELCHLLKASDEDLTLLAPNNTPADTIQRWCTAARLVVLTEGKNGAQAWMRDGDECGHIRCAATTHGPIVDTVGAGDTFQAALMAWLWHNQKLHRTLLDDEVEQMLRFASEAAFLNCTKAGCQPPALVEVRNAMG